MGLDSLEPIRYTRETKEKRDEDVDTRQSPSGVDCEREQQ